METRVLRLVDVVRAGDTVTIITLHNQKRSGCAVMPSSAGGWVLNGGGRYGIPLLADDSNIIKVVKPKTKTKRLDKSTSSF